MSHTYTCIKFLWTNDECLLILMFTFQIVVFGAACSPYLLQQIFTTHIPWYADGPEFLEKFYVDNFISMNNSKDQLINDQGYS